jgi:hypothetical protein
VQLVATVRRFWKGNGLLLNIGHKSTLLYRVRVITKDGRIILNGKWCLLSWGLNFLGTCYREEMLFEK